MIVRVLTDTGNPKPVGLVAKVIEERERDYTICFLAKTEETDHGRTVYQYEDETYVIDDDYVIEYFDDENDAGFVSVEIGWVKDTSDADYVPDPDEDDSCTSDDEDYEDDEHEEYYEEDETYVDDE